MTSGGPVRWLRRQLDFLGSGRLTVLLLPVTLVILYLHLAIPGPSGASTGFSS
jgi:hypothetical protein